MVFILSGPSGSGKTSIANYIKTKVSIDIYTGKDYLRIYKNKDEALSNFIKMLEDTYTLDKDAIYIVTEVDDMKKVRNIKNCKIIRIIASKEHLLERFIKRMDGNNNPAFIKMIEAQLNKWNAEEIDIEYNTSIDSVEAIANSILELK